MAGQFLQPEHHRGDANTIGGYQAVHDRPAAFEGSDGCSYSVELLADQTSDPATPWGGYIMFIRWARIGAQSPEGHLETDFLVLGATPDEALQRLGALSLAAVRDALEARLAAARAATQDRGTSHRWWDAMRQEGQ
jgi:hypothetical protein